MFTFPSIQKINQRTVERGSQSVTGSGKETDAGGQDAVEEGSQSEKRHEQYKKSVYSWMRRIYDQSTDSCNHRDRDGLREQIKKR